MTRAKRRALLESLTARAADLPETLKAYATALIAVVSELCVQIEALEDQSAPALPNGLPRVVWDAEGAPLPLTVLVTESEGVSLVPVDSGLVLETRRQGSTVEVFARRIKPAPMLQGNSNQGEA